MNQRKQKWLVALLLGLTLSLMFGGIAHADETNPPTGQSSAIARNNVLEKLTPEQLFQLELEKNSTGVKGPIIVAIVFGCVFGWPVAVVAAVLFYRYRRDALVHRTLVVMIEKGASIPPELLHPQTPPKHRSDLRRGFTLLGFGIGIIVCFVVLQSKYWGTGFIPMLIGLGYIYAYVIEKKQQPK